MKKGRRSIVIVIALIVLAASGFYIVPHLFHSHGDGVMYTCPMHPQIVQDRPGDCPICGMRLVPMRKEEKKEGDKQGPGVEGLSSVTIEPEMQARLGIAFEKAVTRNIVKEIRTTARILPDETRQFRVNVKVNGWVEKLYVNQTGQYVRRGAPLLSLYSPELLSAQQEYLSALKAARKLSEGQGGDEVIAGSIGEIVQAARERLRLFDISDGQVARIEKTGRVERALIIHAPSSGYVLEKNVFPGQKVMVNDALMSIIDLTRVWGESDIFENDIPYVKTGMPVEVTLPYWPGKVFRGRISFLEPVLNPETRALRARLEIANGDLSLRPNMYGDAKISVALGKRLAVSEGAVMRTGTRDYVFVKKNEAGDIAPAEVKLGARTGDGYFEILSGLIGGEMVVSAANFLVDSESSLKAALKSASEGHRH